MRLALALLFAGGCCVDTYEIVASRAEQPTAQLTVEAAVVSGTLSTLTSGAGLETWMRAASGDEYRLLVPTTINGTYGTTIEIMQGTQTRTLTVIATTALTIGEACLDPGQEDYGTGRCRDTFKGTIKITGDATGDWVIDQGASVVPGTPDC
jgi:hypothetical protein